MEKSSRKRMIQARNPEDRHFKNWHFKNWHFKNWHFEDWHFTKPGNVQLGPAGGATVLPKLPPNSSFCCGFSRPHPKQSRWLQW
jgi:hypothetical protein